MIALPISESSIRSTFLGFITLGGAKKSTVFLIIVPRNVNGTPA